VIRLGQALPLGMAPVDLPEEQAVRREHVPARAVLSAPSP
jgi:hypothetical protein